MSRGTPQAACNAGKRHDVDSLFACCTGRQDNTAIDIAHSQLVIKLDIGLPDQAGGQRDLVFGAHTNFGNLNTPSESMTSDYRLNFHDSHVTSTPQIMFKDT